MLTHHREHVTSTAPIASPDDLPAPADVLDTPPDPRSRRGRRYRLGSLLALSLIAVLGGAASLAAITRCISGYDPDLLARAGLPGTAPLAAGTLRRLLSRLDGDAFDVATCGYLATLATRPLPEADDHRARRTPSVGLAVDGKMLRGSRSSTGSTGSLLAALRHDTQTVAADLGLLRRVFPGY
ncbi:hypothetical protein Plo01_32480 [Planobispora longispora]|uniref:H repeat-associated protein N-terminal domain-containing protein n=1 Tax=Planobispora longispora TaxID=28887 RepID=A0A8J3W4W9_9ACTN|nr:hypothetical protein Plo01_32480 [Planobispora longispora]